MYIFRKRVSRSPRPPTFQLLWVDSASSGNGNKRRFAAPGYRTSSTIDVTNDRRRFPISRQISTCIFNTKSKLDSADISLLPTPSTVARLVARVEGNLRGASVLKRGSLRLPTSSSIVDPPLRRVPREIQRADTRCVRMFTHTRLGRIGRVTARVRHRRWLGGHGHLETFLRSHTHTRTHTSPRHAYPRQRRITQRRNCEQRRKLQRNGDRRGATRRAPTALSASPTLIGFLLSPFINAKNTSVVRADTRTREIAIPRVA